MKHKNIIVSVPEDVHAQIKQYAAQNKISIKDLIMGLLSEKIPDLKNEQPQTMLPTKSRA